MSCTKHKNHELQKKKKVVKWTLPKSITFVSFKEHLGKQAMDLEKISVKHKSDRGLVFRTYKKLFV